MTSNKILKGFAKKAVYNAPIIATALFAYRILDEAASAISRRLPHISERWNSKTAASVNDTVMQSYRKPAIFVLFSKGGMIMNKRNLLLSLIGTLLASGITVAAEEFAIERAHSSVSWAVQHLVITKTKGQFKDFTGSIRFDENNVQNSSVEVVIQAASIDSDDEKRDAHLRSADFLDATNHPTITFKSKKITQNGDGYAAVGDLTIRGVTRETTLPFSLTGPIAGPMGNKRIGIEADVTINRQDFGVSWSKALDSGGLVVGNDVAISIVVEGVAEQMAANK
jgi:polyisoprenoid-binding protein YceI